MKRIEHQFFLERNKLEIPLLLQPIQDKIETFNRMQKLLDKVSDCEKGNLLTELEVLDLEILEDIENEYADKLSFNEIEEEIVNPEPKHEVSVLKEDKLPKKMPKKQKQSNDELILKRLIDSGNSIDISRSKLQKLGFKTPLGWDTTVGEYRLVRTSVFRYRYSII